MKKALIFGAGGIGSCMFKSFSGTHDIVAFADNNPSSWGRDFCGRKIINPIEIRKHNFDTVIVAAEDSEEITRQLMHELDIPPAKIQNEHVSFGKKVRIAALEKIAEMLNRKQVEGATAELGVYRGEFAKHINKLFPGRVLHLFDTFEGFDKRDVLKDRELFTEEYASDMFDYIRAGHLGNTNVKFVLGKMEHHENCRIHKGYFPETAKNVPESENFCFVNIDVDLYQPALEGLRFFYPRLSSGGVILYHDYFAPNYPGAKRAFDQYTDEMSEMRYVPIGDVSMAVVK
jgi:O-methyltransferase